MKGGCVGEPFISIIVIDLQGVRQRRHKFRLKDQTCPISG